MDETPKPPVGRRWQNRPLVRERDSHQVRGSWRILLGILAAIAPAGTFLLCSNDCLEVSYSVSAFQAENERLVKEEQLLKVQRAALSSLPRIEAWAVDEGLVKPRPDRRLVVRRTTRQAGRLVARAPVNGQ